LLLVRRSTLTHWRMTLARDYLRTGKLTLAQIAGRTG
jgi:transcriptional regulator GlxA family with amidase domain